MADALLRVTSDAASDKAGVKVVPVWLFIDSVLIGAVSVLLVNVSVVARPTKVSVAAGKVSVVAPAIAVACTVVFPEVVPATMMDVVKVGLVAKVSAPEPTDVVATAVLRLADVGVAKNVATPVPRPDTPVAMGRPVALVNVPDAGVPKAGVTSVGLVASTVAPVPVTVGVPAYSVFQAAAVVRDVLTTVNTACVEAGIVVMALSPEDCTAIVDVLLLTTTK